MEPRSRRLAPALCAALGFLISSASPLAARASSDEDGDADVPEPVEACLSCHALKPGDEALEGPSLWGVVGRPVASLPGFDYSAALRALGDTWTRERLDRFLTSPQAFAPGTRMELGGVRSAADRKVVLDFLETLRPGAAASPSSAPSAAPPPAGTAPTGAGRDE
jgi:cytochrome c